MNDIAFNRVCLCYAVLQTFDEGLLTKCLFAVISMSRLIEDCYANIPNSPGHMRVYLNIYRVIVLSVVDMQCLLEEVDSNHIPESVKDIVVKVLVSHKEAWERLIYTLLQNDSRPCPKSPM